MGTLKAGLFPVKKCTKCGETKLATLEYFSFAKKGKGGFNAKCKECDAIYSKEYHKNNKEMLAKKLQQWRIANPEKGKEYNKRSCVKNKEKRKERRRKWHTSIAPFTTYKNKLTIEEDPRDDGNGYLEVKCAYCGKYFKPTIRAIRNRIYSLSGKGWGESRLYCSDGCKDACPIFNQHKWPKGFKPATSREVDPLIRQLCLKRDDYTCQKCEKTIDEIELHAHHIEGVKQMPLLANDVDNTITLCKPCHIWVHQQKGCTNYDLRCK